MKMKYGFCKCCGAPLSSYTCEYCGVEYEKASQPVVNKDKVEYHPNAITINEGYAIKLKGITHDNIDVDLIAKVSSSNNKATLVFYNNTEESGVILTGDDVDNGVLDSLLITEEFVETDVSDIEIYVRIHTPCCSFGRFDELHLVVEDRMGTILCDLNLADDCAIYQMVSAFRFDFDETTGCKLLVTAMESDEQHLLKNVS